MTETIYALLVTDPALIGAADMEPGQTITAPSRTALVDALMPGYADAAGQGMDLFRYTFLVGVANTATGVLLARAIESEQVDAAAMSQDEVDALLNTPRDQPVEWGTWDHVVPLVVVPETYRGKALPEGNVIALDGTTETTFLSSLERLGAVEVLVRD